MRKDRGFSLIEFVVVVAIIVALAGIIAPVYVHFVEKSRIQKDLSAAGEIYRAAEIVVYTGEYEIGAQVFVTFNQNGIRLNLDGIENSDEIEKILQEHFGEQYRTAVPVSRKYKDKTYTITILPPEEGSCIPRLSDGWSS